MSEVSFCSDRGKSSTGGDVSFPLAQEARHVPGPIDLWSRGFGSFCGLHLKSAVAYAKLGTNRRNTLHRQSKKLRAVIFKGAFF